jgi:hypothetical protein
MIIGTSHGELKFMSLEILASWERGHDEGSGAPDRTVGSELG